MATNKEALARYTIIDQMLSDTHHYYTTNDILDRVNEYMMEVHGEVLGSCTRRKTGVSKTDEEVRKNGLRVIQMDIKTLQDVPFSLDIDSEIINGRRCWRYSDPTHTLFAKALSMDEKKLLREVINTLGQFSGLDNFQWLEDLQKKLNDDRAFGGNGLISDQVQERKAIQFSSNEYLTGKEHLGRLFSAITSKDVLKIEYRPFSNKPDMDQGDIELIVYPYLLKEYNDRWFLFCTPNKGKEGSYDPNYILNLALDRMVTITVDKRHKFKECRVDLESRFDDIVGVTYYEDREIQTIEFGISSYRYPYITTKPIHPYQKELGVERQKELHELYPELEDFVFFSLELIPNQELLSILLSFGKDIVVLHPEIRNKIQENLHKQLRLYELTSRA